MSESDFAPHESVLVEMLDNGERSAAIYYQLHYNLGWTMQRIADRAGVSRQSVHMLLRRYHPSARQAANRYLQIFKGLTSDESQTYTGTLIRAHVTLRLGPDEVPEYTTNRLVGFWHKLTLAVIEYRPGTRINNYPERGTGWLYLPREPRDGNLVIRPNEHTEAIGAADLWVWQAPTAIELERFDVAGNAGGSGDDADAELGDPGPGGR